MGTARAMRTVAGGEPGPKRTMSRRMSRTRPRAFSEWQALRRWGRLPPWEEGVAGYLLRARRADAHLTQGELADRLGVSQQAVAQAERWGANPTVSFMRRWAEACDAFLELTFVPRTVRAQRHRGVQNSVGLESPDPGSAQPRRASRRGLLGMGDRDAPVARSSARPPQRRC